MPQGDDGRIVIDAVHDAMPLVAGEDAMDITLDIDVRSNVTVAPHERPQIWHRHAPIQPGAGGSFSLVHARGDNENGSAGTVVAPDLVEHGTMGRAIRRCFMERGEVFALPGD